MKTRFSLLFLYKDAKVTASICQNLTSQKEEGGISDVWFESKILMEATLEGLNIVQDTGKKYLFSFQFDWGKSRGVSCN